jgi:ketosteroid isomerase-like protein
MVGSMNEEILAANQAFYDAFAREDIDAMTRLWAEHAPVTCVHPGWPALMGRPHVLASWKAILSNGAPPVQARNPRVLRFGDVACVVCEERILQGRLVATNVFVKEGGAWRMVHHHAGQVADGRDGSDDAPDKPGPSALN